MKALLLDLDNTLIDRDAALLDWLHSVLPESARRQENLDVLVTCDRGGYGSKDALFAELAKQCNASSTHMRRCFFREFPRFARLKSDADAMLRRFTGSTVVVTNGLRSVQRRKVGYAGLAGRVDHIVISGECGMRKPEAGIFQKALLLVGCAPEHALMIGDHPENDIAGARAAGIPTTFVRTRWFDAPSGVRAVQSLTEIAW